MTNDLNFLLMLGGLTFTSLGLLSMAILTRSHNKRILDLETAKQNSMTTQKQILDRLVVLANHSLDVEVKIRNFIADTNSNLNYHERVHRAFAKRLEDLADRQKEQMH